MCCANVMLCRNSRRERKATFIAMPITAATINCHHINDVLDDVSGKKCNPEYAANNNAYNNNHSLLFTPMLYNIQPILGVAQAYLASLYRHRRLLLGSNWCKCRATCRNSLPADLQNIPDTSSFKKRLKTFLFNSAF